MIKNPVTRFVRSIIERVKVNLDPAAHVMDLSIIEKNVGILKGKLREIEIKGFLFPYLTKREGRILYYFF
jgi:hypothetical protein